MPRPGRLDPFARLSHIRRQLFRLHPVTRFTALLRRIGVIRHKVGVPVLLYRAAAKVLRKVCYRDYLRSDAYYNVCRVACPELGSARAAPEPISEGVFDNAHRPEPRSIVSESPEPISEGAAYGPLISILLPISGDACCIKRLAASLLAQTYRNWEICAVADETNLTACYGQIKKALPDRCFVVRQIESSRPYGARCAAALAAADGDYVLRLNPMDTLSPDALSLMAREAARSPEAAVLYYDEDEVTTRGVFRNPQFKPHRFSPEMLLSTPYLAQACVKRTALLRADGYNEEFDDETAWDAQLRLSGCGAEMRHIPHVLLHRGRERKLDATCAEAALRRHATACSSEGAEIRRQRNAWRVIWNERPATVSILIPTRDNPRQLARCLHSLLCRTDYPDFEIILLNNGTRPLGPPTVPPDLARNHRITIVEIQDPFNYSAANNMAARKATGELLLFLNDDVRAVEPGWLRDMAAWAQRPQIGAVGAKLLYPHGHIQHAGVGIGLGLAGHLYWDRPPHYRNAFGSVDWYRNYSALTAACLMVPRRLFHEIGGFDERYVLAFGDVELCRRMEQAGYRLLYDPFACLIHEEGATRRTQTPIQDAQRLFYDMAQDLTEADPWLHPLMSHDHQTPTLAPHDEVDDFERINRLARSLGLDRAVVAEGSDISDAEQAEQFSRPKER